jgi:hypothetical protein
MMAESLESTAAGELAGKRASRRSGWKVWFFLTGVLYGIAARDVSNIAEYHLTRREPPRPAYAEAALLKDGRTGISIADYQGSYAAWFKSREAETATMYALRNLPRPLRRDALQEIDADKDKEITEGELVDYLLNKQ